MRLALPFCLILTLTATSVRSEELSPKELRALERVERELLGLARYAERENDATGAMAALRLLREIRPDHALAESEFERLLKIEERGEPNRRYAASLAKKRSTAHAKVAAALADAALASRKTAPERSERYIELLERRCPTDAAFAKLEMAYYAPYRRYVPKEFVARLEKGHAMIDGAWVDAKALLELERRHRSWSDPWILTDGVHEIRTTIEYRRAMEILGYVGEYRRWFLNRFDSVWDLKRPDGKLPIIVTSTRAELDSVARNYGTSAGHGAAFYLQGPKRLNPCFVCFELVGAGGRVATVSSFERILVPLTHEVTHQICFEYSKHDDNASGSIRNNFWAVEAFASQYSYAVKEKGVWRLAKPRKVRIDDTQFMDGAFAWCQANDSKVTNISEFIKSSLSDFAVAKNYHIGAALSFFMLEGADGKYRAGYIQLLEAVHKVKDTRDLWARCFPDVDLAAMNAEFREFVKATELDD